MKSCSILIIDDHTLFRTGLKMILTQQAYIEEIADVSSVMDALQLTPQSMSLILLDINMPGLNGLAGIKILHKHFKNVPIIILSASEKVDDILDAKRFGAKGFLHKSAMANEINEAIKSVLTGDSCFPVNHSSKQRSSGAMLIDSLTNRQLQVLSLLCEGKTNKVIARELTLAENTVRVHVSAILSFFDVTSRSEAIVSAHRQGLIQTAS